MSTSADDRPGAAPAAGDRHVGTTIEGAPVGSALLQVIRAHARLGTELLRRAGVASPHEIVLLYLDEHGTVPQTELVHYMGRDRSTVTATLQAMQRAGLVVRASAADDRRAMTVALSGRGRALVPDARAAWLELERRSTTALTPAAQEALIAALGLVRDALNSADVEGDSAGLAG